MTNLDAQHAEYHRNIARVEQAFDYIKDKYRARIDAARNTLQEICNEVNADLEARELSGDMNIRELLEL